MRDRTRTYYTDAQKALMWERWKEGWSLQQIAQLFNQHTRRCRKSCPARAAFDLRHEAAAQRL